MRLRTIGLVIAGVVVAVPSAAYGYLAVSTHDAPPRAALPPASSTDNGGPASVVGTWVVAAGTGGFVGYRIRERLGPVPAPSDAVGRTTVVEGSATIVDTQLTAADITADMTKLHSDQKSRDQNLTDNALETARFPTARLRLSAPVDIGKPGRGELRTATIAGELTLHGQTRPISITLKARWDGPTIQVAGSTLVKRADFGIRLDALAGFAIDDTGIVELELTLVPEGASTPASTAATLAAHPAAQTGRPDQPPCQASGPPPPTAGLLLFAANQGDNSNLYTIAADGTGLTPLTTTGDISMGAWSLPNGTEVVEVVSPRSDRSTTLARELAAGGQRTPIPGISGIDQPDWGPDGRIVYVDHHAESSDIWVAGADGANPHLLVRTTGDDSDPRWSPDGRYIVFTTAVAGANQDVVVVDADGNGLRTVAGGPRYEYGPSFSPDGGRIVFVREGSVMMIGLDGTGEQRLTDGTDDASPNLSPDGTRLAFIRSASIFSAAADGSGAACLPTGLSVQTGPRWRP